jgi:hypothetical protein
MPDRKDLRYRMGKEHEQFVAKLLGGDRNPGSGNQWHSQGDGHSVGWGWDCKSSLANSMSISLDTLDKLSEQVYPRRPLLPVRFYGNERLTSFRDYIMVGIDDFQMLYELFE